MSQSWLSYLASSSVVRQVLLTIVPMFCIIVFIIEINNKHSEQKLTTTESMVRVSSATVDQNFAHFFNSRLQYADHVRAAIHSGSWGDPTHVRAFTETVLPILNSQSSFRGVFLADTDSKFSGLALRRSTGDTIVQLNWSDSVRVRRHALAPWTATPQKPSACTSDWCWSNWQYLEGPQVDQLSKPQDEEWFGLALTEVSLAGVSWLFPQQLSNATNTYYDTVSLLAMVRFPSVRGSAVNEAGIVRIVATDSLNSLLNVNLPQKALVVDLQSWRIVGYNGDPLMAGRDVRDIPETTSFITLLLVGLIARDSPGVVKISSQRVEYFASSLPLNGNSKWALVTFGGDTAEHLMLGEHVAWHLNRLSNVTESARYLVTSRVLDDLFDVPDVEEGLIPLYVSAKDVVKAIYICSSVFNCYVVHSAPDGAAAIDVEVHPSNKTSSPRLYSSNAMMNDWKRLSRISVPDFARSPPSISLPSDATAVGPYLEWPPQEFNFGRGVERLFLLSQCVRWPSSHNPSQPNVWMCLRYAFSVNEIRQSMLDMMLMKYGAAAVVFEDGIILTSTDSSPVSTTSILWEVGVGDYLPTAEKFSKLKQNEGEVITDPVTSQSERAIEIYRNEYGKSLWLYLVVNEKLSYSFNEQVVIWKIDWAVVLIITLFVAHICHFVFQLASLHAVGEVLDRAAELDFDERKEPIASECQMNPDIKSMHRNAIALFQTMKRLKPHLPSTVSRRFAGLPVHEDSLPSTAAPVRVFSDLHLQRAAQIYEVFVPVLSVFFPTPDFIASNAVLVSHLTEIVTTCSGTCHGLRTADGTVRLIATWPSPKRDPSALLDAWRAASLMTEAVASSYTAAAAEASRDESSGAPRNSPWCLVTLIMNSAVMGNIGVDRHKRFDVAGKASERTEALVAFVRFLISGDGAAESVPAGERTQLLKYDFPRVLFLSDKETVGAVLATNGCSEAIGLFRSRTIGFAQIMRTPNLLERGDATADIVGHVSVVQWIDPSAAKEAVSLAIGKVFDIVSASVTSSNWRTEAASELQAMVGAGKLVDNVNMLPVADQRLYHLLMLAVKSRNPSYVTAIHTKD